MSSRRVANRAGGASRKAAGTAPRDVRTPAIIGRRSHMWWHAALIVLATTAVYWRSLGYPFVFDDRATIVDNASLRTWPSAAVLFPAREVPSAGRPLVNVSHAINFAIGGLEPWGYRATNLALHIACALIVLALVRRTLKTAPLAGALGAHADDLAFAAAAVWALHPLNTEVVEYVTQRSEALMALCLLATVYAVGRSAESHNRAWSAAAVVSCAAGMLCKESMAVGPVVVWLYDATFLSEGWSASWRRRWPLYLALAATWIVLAAAIWSGPRAYSAGFSTPVSPWTYLMNQAAIIPRYLRLAMWPARLVVAYGPPRSLSLADVWPSAAFVTALVLLTAIALVRMRIAGFVGAWVLLTLAPTSSVVPIATEVAAERRMYLPLVALTAAFVCVLFLIVRPVAKERPVRWFGAAAVAVAIVCATLSYLRTREYASSLTLAETVLERWPTSFAHAIVGTQLAVAGRHDEAIAQLRIAAPAYALARYHLGGELFNERRPADALPELQEFVRLEGWRAEAVPARTMIARALMLQGRWSDAESELRRVLTMAPRGSEFYTTALGFLADTLFSQQRFADAIPVYREFVSLRPHDAGAFINFGVSLAQSGQIADGAAAFHRALQIDPGNAVARRNAAIADEELKSRK